MRCGTKRFLVEMEVESEKQVKSIITRTPTEARKFVRKKHGEKTHIILVREAKKKQ